MKVCLIAVCHGSYEEALLFLDSIEASLIGSEIELDIYFVENSSKFDDEMILQIKRRCMNSFFHYVASENIGYFPSAAAAIKENNIISTDYDYFIISNVDLIISKSFFPTLKNIPFCKNIGVYAPAILSKKTNIDKNPKITERPTAYKLRLNLFLFRRAQTYTLLVLFNYLRVKLTKFIKFILKQARTTQQIKNSNIYAPHGSFILMTKEFFRNNLTLDYPMFLFGEEIYIAERARSSNLEITYTPSLVIYDSEHASTSLLNNKNYRSLNINSLAYLLKTYQWNSHE